MKQKVSEVVVVDSLLQLLLKSINMFITLLGLHIGILVIGCPLISVS